MPCPRRAPPQSPLTRWRPSHPLRASCWAWRRSGAGSALTTGRVLTTVRVGDKGQANARCPLPEACVTLRRVQGCQALGWAVRVRNNDRMHAKVVWACCCVAT